MSPSFATLARVLALAVLGILVIPIALALIGQEWLLLAVFLVLPIAATWSAWILVRAALSGPPIPVLNFAAATVVILAMGSITIGLLVLADVVGLQVPDFAGEIVLLSVQLLSSSIGPAFVLLYQRGYFDGHESS